MIASLYDRLKWALMPTIRAKRMDLFLHTMLPKPGSKILDVGGLPRLGSTPGLWQDHARNFDITLINLPGSFDRFNKSELEPFRLIEADVCTCAPLGQPYDIVFSNAVLEHVGSHRRQRAFANFVKSAGAEYWVESPSPWFPIEAHCNIPFWWLVPARERRRKIDRWKKSKSHLARQMSGTRPIQIHLLQSLFPDSSILTERLFGLPKSHIAYSTKHGAPTTSAAVDRVERLTLPLKQPTMGR